MDCGVYPATGDLWGRLGDSQCVGRVGGFSHESEHDLAAMVSDFLENGSAGAESWCSSDSDSGFCDLAQLADKISYHKFSMDQHETDLPLVVNSLMLSITETDLHLVKSGTCSAGCIRYSLVKLLKLSGYDASVCTTRWQGSGKVPGGDHEYIDVVRYSDTGISERLIIDIDFRSHFEIARAVDSYDRILNSLPVIYVGSLAKLNQLLQVMAEAARSSLNQNSMPLPPWRSVDYLQAKWQSPYQRECSPDEEDHDNPSPNEHMQCIGHLKRLQSSLRYENEIKRLLKPIKSENSRRWRHPILRNP